MRESRQATASELTFINGGLDNREDDTINIPFFVFLLLIFTALRILITFSWMKNMVSINLGEEKKAP